MPLTDTAIRKLKPKEKAYRKADANGLEIEVRKTGGKYWRLRYTFEGKRLMMALGEYPHTSLADARKQAAEYKTMLANGINPQALLKQEKEAQALKTSFAAIAKLWHSKAARKWSEGHAEKVWRRLEQNTFAALGDMPIDTIKPNQIIKILSKIEDKGHNEVAARVLSYISNICQYAVQHEYLETNPARELSGIVGTKQVKHREALPREYVPMFQHDLDRYHAELGGYIVTEIALKLLLHTFVRSGELRQAEWREFDMDAKLWRIPAERMKMKAEHLVPITTQVAELLEQLKLYSGAERLLFPSVRNSDQPISDNTLRLAMFRMGYDGNTEGKPKAVPHGLRATACSILNEQGYNADAIERQMSHAESNKVRAAYTHQAEYLKDRREMMQWWSDYLDKVKPTGEVIPLFNKESV